MSYWETQYPNNNNKDIEGKDLGQVVFWHMKFTRQFHKSDNDKNNLHEK